MISQPLKDAAKVVETILAELNQNTQKLKLEIRSESSLFTNRLDHAVVFDLESGAPILIVEVKKPHDKVEKSPKVFGQVYDSLRCAQVFGNPNPFAILTTYSKTRVFWLDDERSNKIATNAKHDRFRKLRHVDQCSENETPSPPKLTEPSIRQLGANVPVHFKAETKRLCCRSGVFEPNTLVPLFSNSIAYGMNGLTSSPGFQNLSKGTYINQSVLVLNKSFGYGTLSCSVTGDRALDNSDNFFVVAMLGAGKTSKVFHAIDSTGSECAIKMYVKHYDYSTKE